MELSSYIVVVLISTTFLLFLIQKLTTLTPYQRKSSRQPPGPRNLPIIGNLHLLLRSKSNLPHQIFRNLSAVYGPIMRLKLGEINTLVISSNELAREILKTHDIAFAARPLNRTVHALAYGGKNVLFSPYGNFWRQMRRICTLELLSPKRVRSFRAIREQEVSDLIRSISASSGTVVDLSSELAGTTNNVVARAVIGSRCRDQKLFFDALSGVVEFLSGITILDLFPSFPFLGWITGSQRRLDRYQQKIDGMAERIVEEHIEKMAKNSINGKESNDDEQLMEEDIVDVLLRIQREGSLEYPITNDHIKATLVNDMLFPGTETTSTTLEWAMAELIKNPNILKKAQKEVRETINYINLNTKISEESVTNGKLPYLNLVIKETLRLHPPAPLLIPHESQESCQVMGYEIPAKTMVMINVWAIGRDAKYWDDPNTFCPERFEGSTLDFKGANFELIPFGAGRRICPGMQFGLVIVELVLAYLLYYFDWEYLGKNLDMTEGSGVTTRRKHPLLVVPTLHFSSTD